MRPYSALHCHICTDVQSASSYSIIVAVVAFKNTFVNNSIINDSSKYFNFINFPLSYYCVQIDFESFILLATQQDMNETALILVRFEPYSALHSNSCSVSNKHFGMLFIVHSFMCAALAFRLVFWPQLSSPLFTIA